MKRLIIALAACATTLFASAVTVYEGFEGESLSSNWGTGGTLTAYDVGDTQKTAANYPFADSGSQYCAIDSDGEFASPAAPGAEFFDMFVQFPAGSDDPSADLGDAKLAVYLNSENAIVVVSGDGEGGVTNIVFNDANDLVEPGSWVRLTIGQVDGNDGVIKGFRVFIDGTELMSGVYVDEYTQLFLPLIENSSRATQVAFEGSGALDNFVARNQNPFANVDAEEAVSRGMYVRVGDYDGMYYGSITPEGAIAESEALGLPITLLANATIAAWVTPGTSFTIDNPDNLYTLSGAEKFTVSDDGKTYTRNAYWSDYLGDAVAGAYEIDNLDELKAFQENVGTLATADLTFKLTADIALDAAWPGIGLQNGKDDYNTDGFNAAAFCGTFDGQNHTISNFQMVGVAGNPKNNGEGLDYCGFFNSIYNATIQNLKIEYAGSLFAVDTKKDTTHESGATFVGVAKSSTLRNLTTLPGTVSCDKGFGGIVGYLTSGTLVDSCTNNVNMTSLKPNKCGGIAMITQGGSAVTIRNCQNNGTIAGSNETGSLVGYIGLDTTIEDCDSTVAYKLLHHQGSTVTVSGITADASVASYSGAATPGLNFATVDNGVATFVADGALALNGSYKVMGPSDKATATFEFTDLGTIAFDESLATPTYAMTYSGAAGMPTSAKSGNVNTWTAGYFPRTATAGQDGSAAHPFEIADEDDLLALQAAVDANVGRNLSYVQVADIALTAAWGGIGVKGGKDIVSEASYDNGAFMGVYDGGNYTISNFLMENGTDYGALFNSIYNATIKNLKLSWGSSTLCANSSASGGDTGASFVGVAKASTLQNLTTVAGAVTTVSASKDFGGIVGYLMAGSTVESCTNALNVASLKGGRKCGGIAIITQGGTGTAVIRNCKNSGTSAGGAQDGGLVGYVGVATEIDGCENTAAVQLFKFQAGSVTASGVNKGNATVRSSDASVAGLRFATVDGEVATFVADNALALNGSYKVMATGATATFAFAEAGTIAFDTALFTPTYAITAAEGLTLTDATSGTVKTYTATAAGGLDPSTDKTEVTVKIDDAGMSETAVKEAVIAEAAKNVTVPATAEVDATTYLGYFNTTVTGSNGEYTLTLTSLKEEVEEEVEASAITAAQAGDEEATVTTKPGLYYGFVVGESPSLADPEELTLATGASMKVNTKALNGKTAGFVKTVISAKPTMDKQ